MEDLAPLYTRLPSDSGVTFEGFETVRIASREAVRAKLESFLSFCQQSNKPTIRILNGEWGEGKTDAYRRYILTRASSFGLIPLFVSASTLRNCYTDPGSTQLRNTSLLQSVRFLVAVFVSLQKEDPDAKIPDYISFRDAENFVQTTLSKLGVPSKKLVIFVDEFEELLTSSDILRDVISGLKETVNGQFRPIDEGGSFAGGINFVIAATPDAYSQLQMNEETALIFGGLGRRAEVIALPQVGKREGFDFLLDLIRYCYNSKLPPTLPIAKPGTLMLLHRICQGNPGSMVSLFTKLMSSAIRKDNGLLPLSPIQGLNFLETQQVFVYGANSPCVEKEALSKIIATLEGGARDQLVGKKSSGTLLQLIGDLTIHSAQDLEYQSRPLAVVDVVNKINDDLRRLVGIDCSIIKLHSMKDGLGQEDLTKELAEFVTEEYGQRLVRIDSYAEKVEELLERVAFLSVKDDSVVIDVLVPADAPSVFSFFEGISSERSEELANRFRRKLASPDYFYVASEALLAQVFPTPVPRELAYIKDRKKRLQIWRDVGKNLVTQFEQGMANALVEILSSSNDFNIGEITQKTPYPSSRFLRFEYQGNNFNSLLFPSSRDVSADDIEKLHLWIRSTRPPLHCILMITLGDLSQEANDKLVDKGLGSEGDNVVLFFRLHQVLAKRMLAISIASSQQVEKDKKLLQDENQRILDQDLGFQKSVDKWLVTQRTLGVLVPNANLKTATSLSEFSGALRFYINFPGKPLSAEEVYQENERRIMRFLRFGSRGPLPDLELREFERISEDLASYGFLQRQDIRYKLIWHPVEQRILKLLKRYRKLSQQDLQGFFIYEDGRLITDVFLPILEYRGLAAKEGSLYFAVDKASVLAEVSRVYDEFTRLKSRPEIRNYGCAYVTKERAANFISTDEFAEVIDELYHPARTDLEPEDSTLQRLSFMLKFINYFVEEFMPLFEKASKSATAVLREVRRSRDDFVEDMKQIQLGCEKWVKATFDSNNVDESRNVEKLFKDLEGALQLDVRQVAQLVIKLPDPEKKLFYFRHYEEDAFFFNPKLYQLQKSKDAIGSIISKSTPRQKAVLQRFGILESQRADIESRLQKVQVRENLRLTTKALQQLRASLDNLMPSADMKSYEVIDLQRIEKMIDTNTKPLQELMSDIGSALERLSDLSGREIALISRIRNGEELASHLMEVFDHEAYRETARSFSSAVAEIKLDYENRLAKLELIDPSVAAERLKGLVEEVDRLMEHDHHQRIPIEIAWEKLRASIASQVRNLKDVVEIIRRGHAIQVDELERTLHALELRSKVTEIQSLDLSTSKLDEMRREVRRQFYDCVKPVLTKEEAQVLELVVRESRRSSSGWIREDDLVAQAKKELSLDLEQLSKVLSQLRKIKLTVNGLTITA